jgi:hypothetical protein
LYTNFFLNIAFAVFYGLTAYFYLMTMTADPGYIPKSSSRGQTKKTIDDLLENGIFNEKARDGRINCIVVEGGTPWSLRVHIGTFCN